MSGDDELRGCSMITCLTSKLNFGVLCSSGGDYCPMTCGAGDCGLMFSFIEKTRDLLNVGSACGSSAEYPFTKVCDFVFESFLSFLRLVSILMEVLADDLCVDWCA